MVRLSVFVRVRFVLEYRVDVGCYVQLAFPLGGTVFHAVPLLLGVLAFQVHSQPQAAAAAQAHQQVQRVQAGHQLASATGSAGERTRAFLPKRSHPRPSAMLH